HTRAHAGHCRTCPTLRISEEKGRNLTRVCPPCSAPEQNIETAPFAAPCALSVPRRNGKFGVCRQIAADVGGWRTVGAPFQRVGREIDWVLAVRSYSSLDN